MISRRRILQAGACTFASAGAGRLLAAGGPQKPIAGASTSVVAFIGTAESGPVNTPTQVNSFFEFRKVFARPGATQAGRHPDPRRKSQSLLYAVSQFFLNSGKTCFVVRVPSDAPASYLSHAGSFALNGTPFNVLALPGVGDASVLKSAEAYCAQRSAFLIIDAPEGAVTPAQVTAAATGGGIPRSDLAAVYYPWVTINDEYTNKPIMMPPSGSVAGIYAATDTTKGVWKAPAGPTSVLMGVRGLARSLSDAEIAGLSDSGINPLRTLPGVGPVVWGARTFEPSGESPTQYKYVPVRRLAIFIEQSIKQGTQWAVFENNGPALWTQVRQSVAGFMTQLFQQGAFQGSTSSQAYFVKCDATTMTQADIDQGKLIVVVGFAPLKAAEFVILQIGLWAKKP